MRYELYIDVYFVVNFLMDLVLLRMTAEILKRKADTGRILAACAAGACAACAAVVGRAFLPGPAYLRRLGDVVSSVVSAAICCGVAFRPRAGRELLKEMLLLFFLAAVTDGLMEVLLEHTAAGYYAALALGGDRDAGLSFLTWVFLVGGAVFLFRYLWMCAAEVRRESAQLCRVTLHVGDKNLQTTAYRDSGNTLTEPGSGLPVSIVSEGLWYAVFLAAKQQEREFSVIHIRYRTVGNPLGVMEAVQIDSMELYLESGSAEPSSRVPASAAAGIKRENHPWIARAPYPLSQEGNYEMLLPRDLYI